MASGEQGLEPGADHPQVVQPLVAVEVGILGGEEGVADVGRERGRGGVHPGPPLEEVLGADLSVGAADLGDLGRPVVAQRFHRGQPAAEPEEDSHHREDPRPHHGGGDQDGAAEERRLRGAGGRHRRAGGARGAERSTGRERPHVSEGERGGVPSCMRRIALGAHSSPSPSVGWCVPSTPPSVSERTMAIRCPLTWAFT